MFHCTFALQRKVKTYGYGETSRTVVKIKLLVFVSELGYEIFSEKFIEEYENGDALYMAPNVRMEDGQDNSGIPVIEGEDVAENETKERRARVESRARTDSRARAESRARADSKSKKGTVKERRTSKLIKESDDGTLEYNKDEVPFDELIDEDK